MGIRQFLSSARQAIGDFITTRSGASFDMGWYAPNTPAWRAKNYLGYSREGYIENATVYACINMRAKALAGINWRVFKKQANGKKVPLDAHPLLNLLENPNPIFSGAEFDASESAYMDLAGNTYTHLVGGGASDLAPLTKPPIELWLLRPDLVAPVPDTSGIPTKYQYRTTQSAGSEAVEYDRTRIIHRKQFHPTDPIFGLAPTEAAAKGIDTLNAYIDFNYRLLKRNGAPQGVIIAKTKMSDEQYKRLMKQSNDLFNNPNNAGGFKLIEGNEVDVKQFQMTFQDMQFTQGEESRALNICTTYGVPPELIGIQGHKTYANYLEARRAFYLETILPEKDAIRNKRNQKLTILYGPGIYLDYDRDDIEALSEDQKTIWERAQAVPKSSLGTINEAREMVGMEPHTDPIADEILVPVGMIPASQFSDTSQADDDPAGQDPEPDPADPKDPQNPDVKKFVRSITECTALPMVKGQDAKAMFRMFDSQRMAFLRPTRALALKKLRGDYDAVRNLITHLTQKPTQTEVNALVVSALRHRTPDGEAMLRKMWLGIGLHFAKGVDKGLEDSFGGTKSAKANQWAQFIANYLAKHSSKKITEMDETTRKRIMNTLSEGFAKGEGADELAARVEDASADYLGGRALTIARTEIIGASNLGSDAAARSFGLPLNKGWLDTGDDRERDTHAEAAATQQDVPLDDAFEVGGERLMFPGDGSLGAGAEEVANCRCTQTYSVVQ